MQPLENDVLSALLNIYDTGNTEEALLSAILHIDILVDAIDNGYVMPDSAEVKTSAYRKWKRILQKYIEWCASAKVGHDRQAIALGCFRDAIMKGDTLEDLTEARRQLFDLYNYDAPTPFEV